MKILQVGPNSVHVSSFVSALKTDQNSLFLLSEEPFELEEIAHHYVVSFRTLNPVKIVQNISRIKNILLEINPEVVHIHQVNRLAYFVSKVANQLNIRVVTTAWGSDVLLIPKKNALYHFLVKETLKKSAVVTADSKDMIEAMNAILPSDKYTLLQYGIDPIKSVEKEKVIYSNRLHEPLYRIDKIIDYFNDFSKLHPEWKLVIAGSGSETEQLKNKVKSLQLDSKISFVGWQKKDENRNWYARASIYVSLPKSDGTSVSVLEAMSAGCLPVVSNLPVSHEWIVSGQNGIIETQHLNPFIEALELNREDCTERNERLILEKATRKASILQFEKIYRSSGF